VRLTAGLVMLISPVLLMLILLNLRDRRAAQLRQSVLGPLALPELRGRIGVQIQSALFSRKSVVTVDILGATRQEVWEVLTLLAQCLPQGVRLRVRGAVEHELGGRLILETVTSRVSSRPPRVSPVPA
jgi:hypothetical protein